MRRGNAHSGLECLTVTLSPETAELLQAAVEEEGDASADDVIREALQTRGRKNDVELRRLATLRAEINRGMADATEGRCVDFNSKRIAARGRVLLTERSSSASPSRRKRT